jgi:hypothetical protein
MTPSLFEFHRFHHFTSLTPSLPHSLPPSFSHSLPHSLHTPTPSLPHSLTPLLAMEGAMTKDVQALSRRCDFCESSLDQMRKSLDTYLNKRAGEWVSDAVAQWHSDGVIYVHHCVNPLHHYIWTSTHTHSLTHSLTSFHHCITPLHHTEVYTFVYLTLPHSLTRSLMSFPHCASYRSIYICIFDSATLTHSLPPSPLLPLTHSLTHSRSHSLTRIQKPNIPTTCPQCSRTSRPRNLTLSCSKASSSAPKLTPSWTSYCVTTLSVAVSRSCYWVKQRRCLLLRLGWVSVCVCVSVGVSEWVSVCVSECGSKQKLLLAEAK